MFLKKSTVRPSALTAGLALAIIPFSAARAESAKVSLGAQVEQEQLLHSIGVPSSSPNSTEISPVPQEVEISQEEKTTDAKTQKERELAQTKLSNKEWLANDSKRRQAIGASFGTFDFGYYSLYDASKGSVVGCNAWFFCGKKLFGAAGSIDYTRRIKHAGRTSFDIDAQIGIGYQSLSTSWYQSIPESQQTQIFGLVSVVPMARVRLPGAMRRFSVGIGAGVSAAIGNIPYEYPYDIPFMIAINAEITYQTSPTSKNEIAISLRHRCAGFGALNSVDDSQVGSQWAMVGFRRWF